MIPDRPFGAKSIDQSRTVERVWPDSQQQRRLSDDFVSTKAEDLKARVIDFQTASGLEFCDTDGVRTQAEGLGKELVLCRFDRAFLPIPGVKYR